MLGACDWEREGRIGKKKVKAGGFGSHRASPLPHKAKLRLSRPFSWAFSLSLRTLKRLVAVIWTEREPWGSGACLSPCDPVQLSCLESSGRGWTASSPWSPPALPFSDSLTLRFQSSRWLLEFWQWPLSKLSDLERMT